MAYDLVERFSAPSKYYAFYDPGTYQFEESGLKPNTVPFLSKAPRKTSSHAKLWTEAIYNASLPPRVPNITSLKSSVKRFPYEAFSAEDLKQLLCNCGIESSCVCSDSESALVEEKCQRKVKRRIFKGTVPTSSEKRIVVKDITNSRPFYDTRVNESTAFYHGCKWSKRTSKRSTIHIEPGPGPTDYHLERDPTAEEICAENVRALKRKTCKQLRFIEKVQQQNILEGKPGPATYSPEWPKGTNLQFLGPKTARFTSKYSEQPGPADHWLRRDFDPPDTPNVFCLAKLPKPPCFGVKAVRFVPRKEEGPSPATYNPMYKPCHFLHCPTTPFGSSTLRFKPDVADDSEDEEMDDTDECPTKPERKCPEPTWEFKSKTIRMKPLIKTGPKPHPAEMQQNKERVKRSLKLQYFAPFHSSEGRFQPWYNDIPVYGKYETPGPCYYNLEIPKSLPAVNRGPLCRAARFPRYDLNTPAPNEYKVYGGIETILETHNNRLALNIENKHKFVWEPPPEPSTMTYEQREALLIQKCIALLDLDVDSRRKSKITKTKDNVKSKENNEKPSTVTDKPDKNIEKPKMLRTFLYSKQYPNYF